MVLNLNTLQKIKDIIAENSTWTVAHIAAHFGFIQCFQQPDIAKFANTAAVGDRKTPLHIAIESCEIRVISHLILIDGTLQSRDTDGNTACHYAAGTNAEVIQVSHIYQCAGKRTRD